MAKQTEISIELEACLEMAMMSTINPSFKIDWMVTELRYVLSLSYYHNGEKYINVVKLNMEDKEKIEAGYHFTINNGLIVIEKKP